MSVMKGYQDEYLKRDVLLLADVKESFRIKKIFFLKLDPIHFLSTPCYGWNKTQALTAINLTLFRIGGGKGREKGAPTSFSPATSTNVGIKLQNILTFSFKLFATLV